MKFLISFFLISFIYMGALMGQKLPNKQQRSIWASANVKIDGKATEWGGQFQAYNHATDVFYTMANDDKNVYVVLKAQQPQVINRIMGGVTLTFVPYLGKKVQNGISITYPIVESQAAPLFNLKGLDNISESESQKLVLRYNKTLDQYFKSIKIEGISAEEPSISIYNELGIKAAGYFDNRRAYNLEMAIPLKYLERYIHEPKFAYHLVINGRGTKQLPTMEAGPSQQLTAQMAQRIERFNQQIVQQYSPTDFWGEYTLAKKP